MPRNQCLLLPSIYTVYIQLLNQSSATISVFFVEILEMQKLVHIDELKWLYCLYPIFLFAFILFDLINVHRHFPAHIFLGATATATALPLPHWHFLWLSSFSLTVYLFVFDFRCVGVKWREGSSKGKYNYTECSSSCGSWRSLRSLRSLAESTDKSKYLGKQIIWKIFLRTNHKSRCKNYLRILFGKPKTSEQVRRRGRAKCTDADGYIVEL